MRVAASFQQYNDFDKQAAQHWGSIQMNQQVGRGPYSSAVLAGNGDEAAFYIDRTNRQLVRQGVWPGDIITAAVLLPSSGPMIMNGSPLTIGDVMLAGPACEYETSNSAGLQQAAFSVILESEIAVPLRRLAGQQAGRIRRIADPELAGRFRALAANVLQSWDKDAQSVSISASALQELMFEMLTSPSAAGGSSHASIQVYRRARDAMLGALGEKLSISELASRVGTSRRTLEEAFDRCVSVGPARFHKILKLNNARRLLESGQYSVRRAATSSGLHHLGRFPSEYRDLFGELPSQTAQRARVLIADPD